MDPKLLPNAGQYTNTRHLPKTGQTASYAGADDGGTERGWWRGRTNATNKTRFVNKTIAGGAVVIDRATGLMWPSSCTGPGGNGGVPIATWASALAFCNGLNFAGFTDWHLPNMNELQSIVNHGAIPAWHQPYFVNVINNYYWSSTTYLNNVAFALCMRFQFFIGGAFSKAAPGANVYAIAVRECP